MDQRTLRVLEYHKIISLLEEFVLSDLGKDLLKNVTPSSDITKIKNMLDETSQACSVVNYSGYSPMDIFPDIRDILRKAKVGSILSAGELLKVGSVLKVSGRVKADIGKYPKSEDIPLIIQKVKTLILNKDLMDEIFRCIEGEERVSDYASRQLANIRRRITRTNERIRDQLNGLIRSPQFQKFLQEPIVTIRNDRYVVPVKQEHRSSIPGMIHDQSTSGATVYIEPMSVVEANNELRGLMLEEQREIEKVLIRLTEEVQSSHDAIRNNLDLLAILDVIFAKASFSRSYKGVHPEIVTEPTIRIINGRHPLIDKDEVVPITVKIGENSKCLIITGPNTGGKTVTLKTVGLFALMVQSGMHIPADYGSKMGIFGGVFADIGDEQSIEQSLSTFSSHMVHIANIVEQADDRSLVLFDELGAGTDPTEGAALAMAILNYFCEKGTCTIATTHYSELKVFALTQDGMENASMEFDIETLRPTFRLLMGVPGKSNAFEIASRLGLKQGLIDAAREYITQDELQFEDLLTDMEKNRIRAKEDQEKAQAYLDEVRIMKSQLEEKERLIRESEENILRNAHYEAKRILIEAKEQADEILNEMRKLAHQAQDKEQRRNMEQERNRLKRDIDMVEEAIGDTLKPTDGLLAPPKDLKPGESVYIPNLDQTGQVLGISDQGDEVQVQVGIMKINVHISNLRRTQRESKDKKSLSRSVAMKNKSISMELDLRGYDLESALVEVDKYLDNAFLSGLKEVVVIHGKGTGVLRNGIHQYLRNHPHVDSFRLGKFGEGESGVTVVLLK